MTSAWEQENSSLQLRKPLSSTGKILISLTGGVAVGLTVICASFVSPAFRKFCLPYIPATDAQIANVFQALRASRTSKFSTKKLLDLGSGDGRIVLEAAKKQYVAHGVELNPWLVLYSKVTAFLSQKSDENRAKFFRADLWKFNVKEYDVIVIFGVEQMMQQLEEKFLKECRNDSKIVACRFPLPGIRPKLTVGKGVDAVWLYELPKSKKLNLNE